LLRASNLRLGQANRNSKRKGTTNEALLNLNKAASFNQCEIEMMCFPSLTFSVVIVDPVWGLRFSTS